MKLQSASLSSLSQLTHALCSVSPSWRACWFPWFPRRLLRNHEKSLGSRSTAIGVISTDELGHSGLVDGRRVMFYARRHIFAGLVQAARAVGAFACLDAVRVGRVVRASLSPRRATMAGVDCLWPAHAGAGSQFPFQAEP